MVELVAFAAALVAAFVVAPEQKPGQADPQPLPTVLIEGGSAGVPRQKKVLTTELVGDIVARAEMRSISFLPALILQAT